MSIVVSLAVGGITLIGGLEDLRFERKRRYGKMSEAGCNCGKKGGTCNGNECRACEDARTSESRQSEKPSDGPRLYRSEVNVKYRIL
ncbi:hypothetical protein BOVATA_009310 [Babesia ovata]|uniref:Uncharacterized protein n=1 Tax=Babesia ovata TaxID=189622 RepID=A0A2H6K8Y4_9APIC|nr:uncharacterized protein BOVATA_009310 [Babesia ovata]GBE59438.1 hypothetical protein BOVATA_009310 [Babesia ovata]